ncbi:MAG: hypothetical protein KC620_19190, partial [Myxococcales bacterium]|nr:hypothetical protein [Myxococcales bacterium]
MTARPSAFDAIAAQLRRIRRRLRLRAGLAGAGWTLAIVAGLALPGLLAFSVGLPVAWGVLVVLMAGLVALYRTVWRPWRLARADETVAAHVEAAEPMLRDGLLASVQFGREWPTPGRGSKEMAALLAEKVAGQLDALDPSTIGPLAPLRPGWLATAAVAAVWVIAGFVLGEPLSRGWAALTFADDAAGPRETGPLVGDLTLTLNFPPHTHREARVVPNSTGDLEVPKGTRVQLSAVTLSPAREVSLVFGEAAMPLRLSEGRDVTGEFVVSAPTVWRFAMTDAKGHALREGVERRLRIEPDQPPTVTLQYPDQDLELDDLRAVPVAFEARDDFGLSEVAVVIALAADPEHPERIVREGVKGARFADDDTVDLSVINAKPGDRLLLFVEALDNNGVDGPQRGVSATRTITVFSPQAAHFELTERLRRTVEVLLDALADRLELVWRGVEAPPLSKRLADVRVSTREAAAALEGVVDAMADDPLTPDEVRLALTGRLGALEEATEAEKALVEPAGAALDAGEDAVIRAASRANDAVVEQLEQAIILVEAMVARLALEDMAAMAEELKAAREELRALIEAYRKDPNNEALKGRIMRDIERLRARMREMQARMAQLRQKLPEEFLNLDGLKQDDVAKGLDSTQKQLDDLEKMLDEGRIDEALAALDEMEQSLNELSASLDKDMQDLQDETNPEMQRAISELMDQTRELMKRQEKLSADTQQLAEARDAAQQKAMEQEFAEQMKAIEENAAAMQRTIERMAAEDKPMMAEEDVE